MKTDTYVAVSTVDRGISPRPSETVPPRGRPKYYKPTATKTPVLLLFLCAILACIALLEILVHRGEKYTPLPPWQDVSTSHRTTHTNHRRQEDTPTSTDILATTTDPAVQTSTVLSTTEIESSPSPAATPSTTEAPLATTSPTLQAEVSSTPDPSSELVITSSAFVSPSSELTLTTPSSSIVVVSNTAPAVDGLTITSPPISTPTSSTDPGDDEATSITPISQIGSDLLSLTIPTSTEDSIESTGTAPSQLTLTSDTDETPPATEAPTGTGTGNDQLTLTSQPPSAKAGAASASVQVFSISLHTGGSGSGLTLTSQATASSKASQVSPSTAASVQADSVSVQQAPKTSWTTSTPQRTQFPSTTNNGAILSLTSPNPTGTNTVQGSVLSLTSSNPTGTNTIQLSLERPASHSISTSKSTTPQSQHFTIAGGLLSVTSQTTNAGQASVNALPVITATTSKSSKQRPNSTPSGTNTATNSGGTTSGTTAQSGHITIAGGLLTITSSEPFPSSSSLPTPATTFTSIAGGLLSLSSPKGSATQQNKPITLTSTPASHLFLTNTYPDQTSTGSLLTSSSPGRSSKLAGFASTKVESSSVDSDPNTGTVRTVSNELQSQTIIQTHFATYITLLSTTDGSGKATSYYLEYVSTITSELTPTSTVVGDPQPSAALSITSSASSEKSGTGPSSTSTTAAAESTSSSSSGLFDSTQLKIQGAFNKMDYFNAMYLGPFVAVFIKVNYDVVFSAVKMMEPFYQLAKIEGSTAEDSLFSDFLSTGLSWSACRSMFKGHWMILLASTVYVFIGLLAPLAAESMTVRAQSYCVTELSTHQLCDPAWVIVVFTIRVLEGLLGVLAILFISMIIYNWRRKSGVFSNPSSIASVAALLSNTDVLEELQHIDPNADTDTLAKALHGTHYRLGYFETAPGIIRYGIRKIAAYPEPKPSDAYSLSQYSTLSNPANSSLDKPRPNHTHRSWQTWTYLLDALFTLSILALFGIILAYYLDSHSDPFNNYFNSGTFGPRFILTLSASLLDTQWKRLEREVRIMSPYRRLSKRYAHPRNTVLLSLNGTPLTSLFRGIYNGYPSHAWVSFIAVLSDVNIIAVAGIPFSGAQIRPMLLASCYTSMTILGLMVVTMLGIVLWRLDNPRLPRAPESLASVCMMLCGSGMVRDFRHMEEVDSGVRDEAVGRSGRRYWCGVAVGVDGRERWMVDHEDVGGDDGRCGAGSGEKESGGRWGGGAVVGYR